MPLNVQSIARLSAMSLIMGCVTAHADTILVDHFDDDVLDPAWQVSFENAVGWSSAEAGSQLIVTSIEEKATNAWSRVRLTRPLDIVGDFNLESQISWASGDAAEVMQHLIVRLIDAEGTLVAQAFYWDAWVSWRGAIGGDIGDGSHWDNGEHSMPFNGSSILEIGRTDSDVTVWIDGVERVTGTSVQPVEEVHIEFGFYPYEPNGSVVSLFGGESIDLIEITVPDVNDPGDFNGDGTVGVEDLLQLLAAWGGCEGCIEDLDGDGSVGTGDLLMLLGLWG